MSRHRIAFLAAATMAIAMPGLAQAQTPPDASHDHPRGGDEHRDRAAPPANQPGPQARPNGGGDHGNRWGPNAPGGQGGYAGRGDGRPDRGGQIQGVPGGPGGHAPDGGPHGWQGGDRDRPDVNRAGGPHGWQGGDHDRGGPGPHGWQGGDRDNGRVDVYRAGGPRGWQGDAHSDYRGGAWNNDWRGDRRYDWRGWRNGNRALFHGPRYYAPRGYNYRPFSIGFRLDPFLYDQSYWIADPYAYRLPPADGPYRWVRYYNDVLLVDLRTGTVVDAIRDFFW